ncbi:isocitrate lyase/phosphoenolpyruvate mutase family protein [Ktedonosporobacter rubrisoli]|uniref:Isocitrate lyase/phosphoenolpyruvate mutase family protein n=1 Tax=Ktedonosporobacter rubrisoli TaxID=2509675 RepID=A0A4P6JUM3_KTERU|nr:isocitrate lyase/phosphoenolpyruvate mutase family protein [Ktedonosporobacter rubrisoli]QBD79348.1 isocitrate lyase/phosphoenolpyruvate mutase family protein [Ktedonosporobacter rubrisoli]
MTTQHTKAELLLKSHKTATGLLLPNAWDCASAKLFEAAGFSAIGTTSAGIAFAQGYRDGEQIPRKEMLAVIARIAAAVQIPVSADIEAGYGPAPADVAETIHEVIKAGAVGVNLEDSIGMSSLYSIPQQTERIKAARAEGQRAGLPLVINARTDTYLFSIGEEATRLQDTLERGKAYLEAGADSVFVPGVGDPALIEELVRGIPGPLNVMVGPGMLSAPKLFKLGVKRVSVGGAAMMATMGLIWDIACELYVQGTYEQMASHPYDFSAAWKLFTPATTA